MVSLLPARCFNIAENRRDIWIAYTEWADPSPRRDLSGKTEALQLESKETHK